MAMEWSFSYNSFIKLSLFPDKAELKKNVDLPCSYLPTQNRSYPQKIYCLSANFFKNFSLILLTNPSLKSVKALF